MGVSRGKTPLSAKRITIHLESISRADLPPQSPKFLVSTLIFKLFFIARRYRLDGLLYPFLSRHLRVLLFGIIRKPSKPIEGVAIRDALIEMGVMFVKLGQALSVRHDFIPANITEALATLRDDCPPVSEKAITAILTEAFGAPPSEVFARFEPAPMAAASIAQVHSATLKTGERVVVKVVRPDIERNIAVSIRTMTRAARLLNRIARLKRFALPDIVAELARVLSAERDMRAEAANASLIAANFKGDSRLHVPTIYWEYTHQNVLVQERIEGIPIDQTDRLRQANIDFKTLAENGVRIFYKQVFVDNLFHADMHPGNVFVAANGQYQAVDFGMVGSLADEDKHYLAENFLAFFERDYRKVAELHINSAWVNPNTSVVELEAAVRTISEPIFGKPMAEISFAHFLLHLFHVARNFDMRVQPQLILLQKTLFNVEGLGRMLYPELNLWDTAYPFIKDWLKREYSPRTILKEIRAQLPFVRTQLRAWKAQQPTHY